MFHNRDTVSHNHYIVLTNDTIIPCFLTMVVVGHLPVLQPGQVFEYMSGCDLFTKHGTMKGSFHMAIVDGSTRSAIVGDPIDVFGEQNPIVFEMPVHEFALEADDTDG